MILVANQVFYVLRKNAIFWAKSGSFRSMDLAKHEIIFLKSTVFITIPKQLLESRTNMNSPVRDH